MASTVPPPQTDADASFQAYADRKACWLAAGLKRAAAPAFIRCSPNRFRHCRRLVEGLQKSWRGHYRQSPQETRKAISLTSLVPPPVNGHIPAAVGFYTALSFLLASRLVRGLDRKLTGAPSGSTVVSVTEKTACGSFRRLFSVIWRRGFGGSPVRAASAGR